MSVMQGQTVFRFVVAALATWRISFRLAREDGPGGVFARWRNRPRRLGRSLFSCVKCLSLWIAIPFAFFVGGSWGELLVIGLALSGVAALIDEWTRPPFEWQETQDHELLRPAKNDPTD